MTQYQGTAAIRPELGHWDGTLKRWKLQILTDRKKKRATVDTGESPSFVLRFHPDDDDQV
jgi:hypothetical protein